MSWCVALLLGLAVTAASVLYGGLYEPAFRLPSQLLIAAAGGFLAAGAFSNRFRLPFGLAQGAALLLAVYVVARAFALSEPTGWTMLGALATLGILYLGGAWMAASPGARGLFLGILFLTAFGQVAGGMLGAEEGRPHWPLPWLSETLRSWYGDRSSDRLHGFYLNANHLAWLLNSAALFALAYALWARISVPAKITLAVMALALFGASFQTLSRGGLLAMGAGLIALALVSAWLTLFRVGRLRWPFFMMLLGGGIGLFLILQAGLEQMPRYSVRFEIAANDGDYRQEIWPVAWRQFQSEPAWGTGPGTFQYFARMYRQEPQGKDPVFAHNDWLQFLAEQGAIGLLFMLAVLVLHFHQFGVGLKNSAALLPQFREGYPQDTALAGRVGAFAVVVAGATHSFFDFNLHLPANLFLIALCLGWITFAPPTRRESMEWRTYAGAVVSLALTVLALIFVGFRGEAAIRQLQAENAIAKNRWREALVFSGIATQGQPHSAAAWNAFAQAERQRGNQELFPEVRGEAYRSAAHGFQIAKQLEPQESAHALNRADALLRAGLPKEAGALAAQAIALNPLELPPYQYAALAAATGGNRADAQRLYGIALKIPGPTGFARDQIRREAPRKTNLPPRN